MLNEGMHGDADQCQASHQALGHASTMQLSCHAHTPQDVHGTSYICLAFVMPSNLSSPASNTACPHQGQFVGQLDDPVNSVVVLLSCQLLSPVQDISQH